MDGSTGHWFPFVFSMALAFTACGSSAEPAGSSNTSAQTTTVETSQSSSIPSESTVAGTQVEGGEPIIREMAATEWEQFSNLDDNGMMCPKPDTKAGDAFWDYEGDFDPSEYGRKPGDALKDAVTEMNDGYKTETGNTEGFLPESGWVGLTHEDGNTIYFVYPERSWEFIVTVSGDSSKGAWRHSKATVCAPAD